MKKYFLAADQKCTKRKIKRSIENNLNAQTRVNRSTYLKRVLRNQVYSYNQDELLKDDGWLNTIQVWRWVTSFLLIFSPKFLLVDLFMLVSCPGCHGIQCFELCGINEKKKEFGKKFICDSVALFVVYIQYSHTFFTSKSW